VALLSVAAVLLALYGAWLFAGPRDYLPVRDLLLYCLLLTVPVISFTGRALRSAVTRSGWWVFAVGALTWLVAETAYIISTADTDTEPWPWVDWLYIVAPALFYAAVILLARATLRAATTSVWLDGLIITFTMSAFGTLFVPDLLETFSGSPAEVFIDITGPLTSLLLVSLVVAILGLTQGSAGTMWWFLLIGAGCLWAADLMWLFELADSSYFNGSLLDLGWPVGMVTMGAAAWLPVNRNAVAPEHKWTLPLTVTLVAFGIVLLGTVRDIPQVTVGFAAAAVLAGGLRSARAFRSASARMETERKAHHDDLTGLSNRRGLSAAMAAGAIGSRALLLVDIDRFKQINETLGHQAGDDVLQQVGARLRDCLSEDAVLARLGGDEFAVLMPAESGWAGALATADRIHDALAEPVVATGIELQLEVGVGIAFSPQHGTNLSELQRTADRALQRAKRDHVGSLVFDQNWDSGDHGGLLIMQELRRAIDDDEFTCHFQPQLDVLTDQVVAVESLVRWHHPQRGLIPAEQFLTAVEQTALIRPLTDLVLEKSLTQLRAWDAQGLQLRMSVNLSATNLMDRALPLRVAQMLASHRIPAPRLTLEITETAVTGDQDRLSAVLGQLHEIGVHIAIDDYGSGYSSLRQIGRLSAQELKLDRDFVTGVGNRGDLRSILFATVHLAHGLRLRMVAEGVESASDLDQVRSSGCDLAQGFFICPPRSAEEITEWLQARTSPVPDPLRNPDRDQQPR